MPQFFTYTKRNILASTKVFPRIFYKIRMRWALNYIIIYVSLQTHILLELETCVGVCSLLTGR